MSNKSFGPEELQASVLRELRLLGYEIAGSDDIGWTVLYCDKKLGRNRLDFDTCSEAIEAAHADLVLCNQELLASARRVTQDWDTNHLANAVNDLAVWVQALDPHGSVPARKQARDERLRTRLERLAAGGLTFSDCIEAFGVSSDVCPTAKRAHAQFHREGELEFGSHTVVSRGDDAGAYVMAWVWVPDE